MKARLGHREIEIDQRWVRGGVEGHATERTHVPGPKATSVPNRRGSDRPNKNRESGIDPAPSPSSPSRSKLEARYANDLEGLRIAGQIAEWHYEPCVLKLSETARYRPDFLVVHRESHRMYFVEVKGWSKNRRDGLTRLKWAAQKYWWWEFRLVEWTDGSWQEQVM